MGFFILRARARIAWRIGPCLVARTGWTLHGIDRLFVIRNAGAGGGGFRRPVRVRDALWLGFPGVEGGEQGANVGSAGVRAEIGVYVGEVHEDKGHLPMGKATELARMTRREFMQLIQEREICRPFDDEELERELSW